MVIVTLNSLDANRSEAYQVSQRILDHTGHREPKGVSSRGITRIHSMKPHPPTPFQWLPFRILSFLWTKDCCVSPFFSCPNGCFILSLLHHYTVEQATLWFIGGKPWGATLCFAKRTVYYLDVVNWMDLWRNYVLCMRRRVLLEIWWLEAWGRGIAVHC